MADTKITGLTALATPALEDLLAIVDDPSGTPITKKVTLTDLQALVAPAASGTVPGRIEIAVQAEQEAGTDNTRAVSPAVQHFHPSAAKFWVYWTANSTTILASYNMTSIADTAVGDADGTIANDFSGASWAGFVCTNDSTANGWDANSIESCGFNARAAGTFGVLCGQMIDGGTAVGNLIDPEQWQVVGFGDL